MKKFSLFNATSLTLGFSFLYLPIILLIIYSFNESKLVTVWQGFSFRWYIELFKNKDLLDAAINSLKIAFISSTLATILGMLVAISMVDFRRFRGRTLFSGMINAPLIMPEVITGISLLLFFVAVNLKRGLLTITIAHITFCMCYASVVITSRLSSFDKFLSEAAKDLGCTPLKSFLFVTLPNIFPAVISAWLLSFTLSMDDLVIASFTSGPGSTTLPMEVYSKVRLGVTPEINALSTILVLVITVLVISASVLGRYNIARNKDN